MDSPLVQIIGSMSEFNEINKLNKPELINEINHNIPEDSSDTLNEDRSEILDDKLPFESDEEITISCGKHFFLYSLCAFALFCNTYSSIDLFYKLDINKLHSIVLTWLMIILVISITLPIILAIDYSEDPEWYWSLLTLTNDNLVDKRNTAYKHSIYKQAYNDFITELNNITEVDTQDIQDAPSTVDISQLNFDTQNTEASIDLSSVNTYQNSVENISPFDIESNITVNQPSSNEIIVDNTENTENTYNTKDPENIIVMNIITSDTLNSTNTLSEMSLTDKKNQ